VRRGSSGKSTPADRPERSLCRRSERGAVSDPWEAIALLDLDECEWTESDVAELREFMACERLSRRADPGFRERLRLELWWSLVVRRSSSRDPIARA